MANHTILLIDYEPRSIERFRDPLTAAGYSVEIATDGVSGIEAFHRLSPDMVLVEAMIPKKHGFEVCQELKRTPHGRKTPVIITTGVYKGRKYRTQALHIYGCDEYIEKPIAPEQLLEIVGKLFGSASTGPSARPADSGRSSSATNDAAGGAGSVDAIAKPVPSSASKDDTEDEIMARLDALLPRPVVEAGGNGGATPPTAKTGVLTVVTAIDQDPFAQMRAELDAELGANTEPLTFENAPKLEPMPETMPTDQAVSPSVLEALPVPDADIQIVPLPTGTPIVTKDESAGRIVNFETKGSRKGKKNERKNKDRSPQVSNVALAPGSTSGSSPAPKPATRAAAPLGIEPHVAVSEVKLPRGTIVESELDSSTERRGKSLWLWVVVGAVAVVALALVFWPRGSSRSEVDPTPTPPPEAVASAPPVASAPVETRAPEAISAPAETSTPVVSGIASGERAAVDAAPKTHEPVPVVPDRPKPVVATAKPPVSKKPSERKSTPPAPAPPVVASTNTEPGRKSTTTTEATKVARAEAPAAQDLDANVAGVETVPDPATGNATAKIAPGALIPIDVADTMPIALTHRSPVFSTQATQAIRSGNIVMNVLVNDRGGVDQVVLVTGLSDASLNDAAMRAARSWTYRPATKNGVPVKVWKSEQVVLKP